MTQPSIQPSTQLLASASQASQWLRARAPGARLCTDSRQLQAGDIFIAWPGQAHDARRHVPAALAAGAAACLVEAEGLAALQLQLDAAPSSSPQASPRPTLVDDRVAALAGLKAATGPIAADWLGQPGSQLKLVAVTATNGKTSTAWWTAQALSALGQRCGVVGTLGIGEPPKVAEANANADGVDDPADRSPLGSLVATGLTTPDPVTLQKALRGMVDQGFAACALEASSIGLSEHRLAGTPIAVAQFINFTQDHLDYHGSMASYWSAKRALFDWPGLQAAVVDTDDAQGLALAAELRAGTLDLWTTSHHQADARLRAVDVQHASAGLAFTLVERQADGATTQAGVTSALVGEHNVHNLLAVLGALRALGVSLAQAAAVVRHLGPVPGRLQPVPSAPGAAPQPLVLVDYAHTPDALEKALRALQALTIARGGRLWCVFGCGGNRDAGKRALMGAVAQRLADIVLLTSDNPRDEDPADILRQIGAGLTDQADVLVIEDRRLAIAHAVAQAAPADVVLLAGKGHEDYQEVAGQRRPFSDLAEAAKALAQRAAAVQAVAGVQP